MIEVASLVAVGGFVLSYLGYMAGKKKNSDTDIITRAKFEATISVKLDNLANMVNSLSDKLTTNTAELHKEIEKSILDHEKRYHSDGA